MEFKITPVGFYTNDDCLIVSLNELTENEKAVVLLDIQEYNTTKIVQLLKIVEAAKH